MRTNIEIYDDGKWRALTAKESRYHIRIGANPNHGTLTRTDQYGEHVIGRVRWDGK